MIAPNPGYKLANRPGDTDYAQMFTDVSRKRQSFPAKVSESFLQELKRSTALYIRVCKAVTE
jgi:hypothetical protein